MPAGFQLGVATSAFQIEGAAREDGKSPSIWDTFCRQPGAIGDGSNADIACDHYHRMEDDVRLMQDLGIRAYRFSISWPRILPNGRGRVEPRGLSFYHRLVDALLAAGITPFATLYHWDLPQVLQDQGGWPARERVEDFVRYADVVTASLGDRVKHWVTHNEPWCIAILGHWVGCHAPGLKNPAAALAAAHHVLLSHGAAAPVIRANSPDCRVGICLNLSPAVAASSREEDLEAARHYDGYFNRWFLDPLYGHGYPEDMMADYRKAGILPDGPLPFVREGDLARIATPCDFLGVNYYTREICRSATAVSPENAAAAASGAVSASPHVEKTEMGWEVYPEGLFETLRRLFVGYRVPSIYVLENGCSYSDGPNAQGVIEDERRIRYLGAHIEQALHAMACGLPLAGYFVWSLMDNFEWQHGFRQRFGLVWMDYATQRRIPKQSAWWYSATTRRLCGSAPIARSGLREGALCRPKY